MRYLLHIIIKAYGETRWLLSGGANPGYYWALRASCNWCLLDWYGRPCIKVFNHVGWIR